MKIFFRQDKPDNQDIIFLAFLKKDKNYLGAIKLLFSAGGGLNFLPSCSLSRRAGGREKTKDKSSQSCKSCLAGSTQDACFF